MEITRRIKAKMKFYSKYFISFLFGAAYSRKFNKIEKFILFLGYSRSGHTLVASLLDAHPNILIGNEWNSLQYVKLGFKKKQVFYSLLSNSQQFTSKNKNIWTGYNYQIDGLYQGKIQNKLKIIGDKSAGLATLMIHSNYNDLVYFKNIIKKPIVLLHVIRNPYDIITTMTKRTLKREGYSGRLDSLKLLPKIKMFFDSAETISMLKKQREYLLFDLYHEDLVNSPYTNLLTLFQFLGISWPDKYIEKCINIINKIPHKSRFEADWSDELILFVQKRINKYDFLKRYNFSN